MFRLNGLIFLRTTWNIEQYFSEWFEISKLSSYRLHTLFSLNYIPYVSLWMKGSLLLSTVCDSTIAKIASNCIARNNYSLVLVKRNSVHLKKNYSLAFVVTLYPHNCKNHKQSRFRDSGTNYTWEQDVNLFLQHSQPRLDKQYSTQIHFALFELPKSWT